jgi:hypothetical protein
MIQPPPAPPPVVGFCGRCGLGFGPAAGPYCGRCGNTLAISPAAAVGYSYPVLPSATVPATQHRMGSRKLGLVAAAMIATLVVVITVVTVVLRPQTQPCGFYCGPKVGPPLTSPTSYQNQKFGFSIDYPGNALQVTSQADDNVHFATASDGEIVFLARSGEALDQAVQEGLSLFPGASFANQQQVGSVPGAEIGFVPGQGVALQASYTPTAGGAQGVPVGIVVIAAQKDNLTLVAAMWSQLDDKISNYPFGLDQASLFDFPISNTHFPGQT